VAKLRQIKIKIGLTINAADNSLMRNFHRPEDEKRMVVILSPDYFDEWLSAKPGQSARFLIPYPADQLEVAASTIFN